MCKRLNIILKKTRICWELNWDPERYNVDKLVRKNQKKCECRVQQQY